MYEEYLDSAKESFLKTIDKNLNLDFESLNDDNKQKILDNLKINKEGSKESYYYRIYSEVEENKKRLLLGYLSQELDTIQPLQTYMSNEETKGKFTKYESVTKGPDASSSRISNYTYKPKSIGFKKTIYEESRFVTGDTEEKHLSYRIGENHHISCNNKGDFETDITGIDSITPDKVLSAAHLAGEYCKESFDKGKYFEVTLSDFKNIAKEVEKGTNKEKILKQIEVTNAERLGPEK